MLCVQALVSLIILRCVFFLTLSLLMLPIKLQLILDIVEKINIISLSNVFFSFIYFLANLPTPIKTPGFYYKGAMCIVPNVTIAEDCSVIPDGTKLVYKSMPSTLKSFYFIRLKFLKLNIPHNLSVKKAQSTISQDVAKCI